MTQAPQVVLVTGGSRGIGRACVLRLVANGDRVVFCSRSGGEEMQSVQDESAAFGPPGSAVGVTADISLERDVRRLFTTALDHFGEVDSVIHNAAISRESLLVSTTPEDLKAVLMINLTGSFLVVRQALRVFLEQGRGGRIVLIGSLSQNGAPGNAVYAACKGGAAALVRLVTHLHPDCAIRCNAIIPGYVETALSESLSEDARRALVDGCPQRRSASPLEIASLAAYLLSDGARGIAGQTVFATGGLLEVQL